ncbi:MAG: FkbM family methyltransferase [Candidatus Didemnitutus sp.]|nr:FkbM family methyltransferase [Candidatus Didemnitutus sp.]
MKIPELVPLPLPLRCLRPWEFPGKLGLMERLFSRTLARHGVAWIETNAGIPWELDLATPPHRWIVYGYYEGYAFWRWLLANRDRIRTVVDSGANIGQTTLYFSQLLTQPRIFAYEPGADARAWLTRCVEANRLAQVSISSHGLAAAPGTAFLRSVGDATTHGSWNRLDAIEGDAIPLVTLDDEMARLGLDRIDLWKLDMEGAEPGALAGAARALAAGKIGAVHAEIMGDSGPGVGETLRSHGYVPYVARRNRLVPAAGVLSGEGDNAVFIHPSSGLLPPA